MSEPSPASAEEIERISLLRDPPPPPGYVDPLADSPALDSPRGPEPEGSLATTDVPGTRSRS
jgi:hypothetical protein